MTKKLVAHIKARLLRAAAVAVATTLAVAAAASAAPLESTASTTSYHRVKVDGIGIFYREAGPRNAPTIVLLHGFPSSSREFDTLIPLLAPRYHVIAPDFPGFGQSDAPAASAYAYTFDHLAGVMNDLLTSLKIDRYSLYIHDYGAPVGFRMMVAHPERLQALITQNGNAYQEGLGTKWSKIAQYWADPEGHPEVVDAFLSFEATEQRHTAGSTHPERYNPDTWTDEFTHLSKPGQREIQSALLYDYRTNVAAYPKWQAWLREHKPPTLVAWGANDPSFIAPGATAFKKDLPDAEVHLLDAGHFALDEQTDEIARLILNFMAGHPG
ncbi:alpha/beta fold hydrolase [Nitrospirillum amazonense]|uniref:Pimeloyl-ACP methyl ester carboxylesterase n=1 Tax=Nitrospirillum amazonense TaxID=28077 RepID=A0A560KIS6_9PROT|nr:alpha/beta hydrolase [Nitrospirillum amazonense]MDG3439550.1 alpha/beta hydrolase [Nitrospirillum amazonense]TWB83086.1 pimeloyl-ACP methyl ester carboxylesterase [Nitrospirillum amazonense]